MANNAATHTLYHNPFSICSIMVRYAFAVRGEPKDSQHRMNLREEIYDIMNKEQLSEHYLCDINANGEVPVLEFPNGKTMPESVDITYEIAKSYPSLLPTEHEKEIKRLVGALHNINFFSLTFTGKPQSAQGNIAFLKQQLDKDISERYRKAIHHKIQRIQNRKLSGLEPESVEEAIKRTKQWMAEIQPLVAQSKTGWCFDTTEPNALDAHLVVFLARLHDVRRDNLVPESVRKYGEVAMNQKAWKNTMEDRRTMPPQWFA